ncbi:MAG: hypothetical protein ABSF64_22140 [Bryobacteraceae bacterium]|jgi:hypothetical protein
MGASAQNAEPALAAIDLDQDDWYVAVGDAAGGGETRVLHDAAQLTAFVGSAPVVATVECRNELARVAPQIQARFVPRLASVARTFRAELGGHPCLVFWLGREHAICGLVKGDDVAAENADPQLALFGIFQHFAANLPGLQAWMKDREKPQRAAAFERFVSNLRDGTTLDVGGGRWMRTPARVPPLLVKEGFQRLRASVDPERQAAKLVVSGWASAAHWDLAGTLGAEFPDLKLISRPNGSGFYESVAGLMDYGWANPVPGQARPAALWMPGKSLPAPDPVTAAPSSDSAVKPPPPPPVLEREPLLETAPNTTDTALEPPTATAPPATAPTVTAPTVTPPPVTAPPVNAPPVTAPQATAPQATAPPVTAPPATAPQATAPTITAPLIPAPPPTPAPDLKLEAAELQSKPVVRLSKAAAALVGSLGKRGATHRQNLKTYLALAQQSEKLSGIMERGDADAQRKELNSFRDAVALLEKNHKPEDFYGLLDEFASDEPGAVEICNHFGMEPIPLAIGSEVLLSSAKLEVIARKGTGKRARIADIQHRGYRIGAEVIRQPRVSLEFYDVKRTRRRYLLWWVAGALAVLAVVLFLRRPSGIKRAATAAVGEPVSSVWSVPGTRLLVAQSGSGQACNLRIWQAPVWDNPVVLPAPCGPVAVSPDGNLAAWSSTDGHLPTITKTNNVPLLTMGPQEHQHDGTITALGFTPDGQFLYSAATDGFVRQWKVQGEYVKDLADPDPPRPFQTLLVAANLVAAGEATSPGARIKVWLAGLEEPVQLKGANQAITAMAYDPESRLFFAGTADGEILTWKLEGHYDADHYGEQKVSKGQIIELAPCAGCLHERPVPEKTQTMALAPGARLFVGYADALFSWRYADGKFPQDKPFKFGNSISGAATVSDGQTTFLAVGGGGDDHSIGIWRIAQ